MYSGTDIGSSARADKTRNTKKKMEFLIVLHNFLLFSGSTSLNNFAHFFSLMSFALWIPSPFRLKNLAAAKEAEAIKETTNTPPQT